jgi:hypothetical protein
MTNAVQEFFTWNSLGTIAGASAAVCIVTNTIRKLFSWSSPIVPFGVALIITVVGSWQIGTLQKIGDYGLAFLNSCLLFCTATGAQESAVEALKPQKEAGPTRHGFRSLKWFSSWLHD